MRGWIPRGKQRPRVYLGCISVYQRVVSLWVVVGWLGLDRDGPRALVYFIPSVRWLRGRVWRGR